MLKEIIISKSGFPFYTDYWENYFCKMTGEQVKESMRIIFHFNKTFEMLQTNDLAVEMVITTIIENIKRDAEKRSKKIVANRENGKTGGRPKKEEEPKKEQKKPIRLFVPPTLEEVKTYCQERQNTVNPQKFFDYYTAGNWKDGKGQPVKNWKQKLLTWESKQGDKPTQNNQSLCKAINKLAGSNLIAKIEVIGSKAAFYTTKEGWQSITALDSNVKSEIKKTLDAALGVSEIEAKY